MARVRRSPEEILLDELTAAENTMKEAQEKLDEATNTYNEKKKKYDELQKEKLLKAIQKSGKTYEEIIALIEG